MTEPSNSANGAMLSPGPSKIEVTTGGFVDVLDPDPATLSLHDIARGMAFTCRYGGHVRRFYSVAEHAVLVHDLMRWQGASEPALIGALFHDAAEAYLGDLVAPLKWALRSAEFDYPGAIHRASRLDDFMGAYAQLSYRMDGAICARFDLDQRYFDSRELRVADMWALRIEARHLTASGGAHWRWPGELPHDGELPAGVTWHGGHDPNDAERLWLDTVSEYRTLEEVADAA